MFSDDFRNPRRRRAGSARSSCRSASTSQPLHLGVVGGGPRDRVVRHPPPAGPDELVDREVPPDVPDADEVVSDGRTAPAPCTVAYNYQCEGSILRT